MPLDLANGHGSPHVLTCWLESESHKVGAVLVAYTENSVKMGAPGTSMGESTFVYWCRPNLPTKVDSIACGVVEISQIPGCWHR
jgi:hypothetical protein